MNNNIELNQLDQKNNIVMQLQNLRNMNNILYWVSLLIQDTPNSKPRLISISDGYTNFDDAIKAIKNSRNNYRTLSAWIDIYDENMNVFTIYHECFVNAIGTVYTKNI